MAATVVNFLLEKLSLLLSEDTKLIAGAREEFQDLRNQVRSLYDFLDDDVVAKTEKLEKEIRSIVYKTEDVIDKFLVQEKMHQEKNRVFRIKCLDASRMNRVHDLTKKINNIIEKMDQLTGAQNRQAPPHPNAKRLLTENFRRDIKPRDSAQEPQGPELVNEEVIGLDHEAEVVISRLLKGSACLEVIPIVGMLGLGKTTLAKKVFMDARMTYEFFGFIWIYVGQSYNMKEVFLKILTQLTGRIEEYQDIDTDVLARIIRDYISKGGKFLLVLDDVWEALVMDFVKKIFPKNNKGHRIMMTTRNRHLACYANAVPHDLKFLTDTESFELLRNRVFGERNSFPDNLIELGQITARRCCGLPLAIVVIAGALRRCTKKSDWLKIAENVEQRLINREDPSSCLNLVNTSYNQLSEEMQACFLYFGVFPQGFDIPAWKLIRLWIAEGLIKPNRLRALEETAKNYLNDLVNRNLVTVAQKTCDGNVKICRVHGVLHNFCKEEASCKWLFQEVCRNADQAIVTIQDPVTSRRLCIQSSDLNDFLSTEPVAEHVRSFYCFSSEQRQIELPPSQIKLFHKAFPLIRVLDIESAKFLFSKDFTRLFHLRYLAISGDFQALPLSFGKFWNLQTLILWSSTSEHTLNIKANIWNMLRLRHLHTNIPAILPPPPTPTGKSSCLQTFSVVSPKSCSKDVLAKACNLGKLSIRGQMTDFFESGKGEWHNLEELKCLEHLKLLNLDLYRGKSFHVIPPSFINFLRTLKKLTLSNTWFDWSEAEKLGQLECLEVLKLKENAFTGESWRPEMGGFSQLQILWIERADLKVWEASEVHFPRLSYLILISCENLEAIPFGLADIPSLQEMRLENTHRSAVKSAREIQRKKLESIKFKLTIFPPEN